MSVKELNKGLVNINSISFNGKRILLTRQMKTKKKKNRNNDINLNEALYREKTLFSFYFSHALIIGSFFLEFI